MTREEAIEAVKMAQSQVEWEYPMDYVAAFAVAIEALKEPPRSHGRWIINDRGLFYAECSCCRKKAYANRKRNLHLVKTDFCPCCGAIMDGEETS